MLILIGLLTLIPNALIWIFFAFVEYLDWHGRLDVLAENYPKVWRVLRDRSFRLVMLCLVFAALAADLKENLKQLDVEPPPMRFVWPRAPEITKTEQPESPDSLRRRTIKSADDLYDFLAERQLHHKGRMVAPANDEATRQSSIEWQEYEDETAKLYSRLYEDTIVGIIREYKAQNVDTGTLEEDAGHRVLTAVVPGSIFAGQSWDEVGHFRELAWHVDAKGHRIDIP